MFVSINLKYMHQVNLIHMNVKMTRNLLCSHFLNYSPNSPQMYSPQIPSFRSECNISLSLLFDISVTGSQRSHRG